MKADVQAIGYVRAARSHAEDDFWGGERAAIALADGFSADALAGLCEFSHVEVLHLFHQVDPAAVVMGARRPRHGDAWAAVGIFAQRGKQRPNRIGRTICRTVRAEETTLFVEELDAIDGTPVLDREPVMIEFLRRGEIRQPRWSHEPVREYWTTRDR